MSDWDTLRVILAVSREGSLSSAARHLGVNQATVGRRIKRAEDDFEAKLFDRFNNGLVPTTSGKTAIETAKLIEAEVMDLSLKILGADHAETGNIRLSVPLSLMPYGLSCDIFEFQQRHAGIKVDIIASDETLRFVEREVEIFIRAESNPSSGLWGYKLAELNFGFYASAKFLKMWHTKMVGDPKTAAVPFIVRSNSEQDHDIASFRNVYPKAETVATCGDLESLTALIRSNVGVGRVPHFIANHHTDLVPILWDEKEPGRPLWVLTYPDLRDTSRIRLFMDLMKARFAERQDYFTKSPKRLD